MITKFARMPMWRHSPLAWSTEGGGATKEAETSMNEMLAGDVEV